MNVTGVNHPASPLEFFAISFTFINSVNFERQEGGQGWNILCICYIRRWVIEHFQIKVQEMFHTELDMVLVHAKLIGNILGCFGWLPGCCDAVVKAFF